jgi:DNA topoisomerase-1
MPSRQTRAGPAGGLQDQPLLWRKIRRGLSAGRVQSAALKIICDRRSHPGLFPKEYWNITVSAERAKGKKKQKPFPAKLTEYQGKKLPVSSKAEADKVLSALGFQRGM